MRAAAGLRRLITEVFAVSSARDVDAAFAKLRVRVVGEDAVIAVSLDVDAAFAKLRVRVVG